MAIRTKNGALLLNQAGTGLRESCPSSCTVQLTRYTYSPCTPDASGSNYHRGLYLDPAVCTYDPAQAQPSLAWQSLPSTQSVTWPASSDSTAINAVKALARQSRTVGCASVELGGTNAEYATLAGPCGSWFANAPCCSTDCSNRNASGHFYYRVAISGACGKAYCYWVYGADGTPTQYDPASHTVYMAGRRVWLSPSNTFSGTGTHDIDRAWNSTSGEVPEGPGLLVVFVA